MGRGISEFKLHLVNWKTVYTPFSNSIFGIQNPVQLGRLCWVRERLYGKGW